VLELTVIAPPTYRGLNVRILEFNTRWIFDEVPTPAKFLNIFRGQYRADSLAVYLSREFEIPGKRVFVVDGDGYVEGLNFVFGLALPEYQTAVVFTERLKGRRFEERLAKEITHESGHLYGLGHCANPLCVMSFSNSVIDVDRKGATFCPRCRARIARALRQS